MFETTIDGFDFVLTNGICVVIVDDVEIGRFSTLNPAGLPTISTQQEFENEAMWWIYKNVQV